MQFLNKNWWWTRCTCKKVIWKQVIGKYRLTALAKKTNLPRVLSKKVILMAGLAVLTNKYLIHLIYVWLLHAMHFSQKRQVIGAGGLAVLSKKYCIHLIYICLSHVMQFSKKKKTGHRGIWARCLWTKY